MLNTTDVRLFAPEDPSETRAKCFKTHTVKVHSRSSFAPAKNTDKVKLRQKTRCSMCVCSNSPCLVQVQKTRYLSSKNVWESYGIDLNPYKLWVNLWPYKNQPLHSGNTMEQILLTLLFSFITVKQQGRDHTWKLALTREIPNKNMMGSINEALLPVLQSHISPWQQLRRIPLPASSEDSGKTSNTAHPSKWQCQRSQVC